MKNKKGITLIALVITIIVLLILAGVTIATLTGENGILDRAKTAREKNDEAQEYEDSTLAEYEKWIDARGDVAGGSGIKTDDPQLIEFFNNVNYKITLKDIFESKGAMESIAKDTKSVDYIVSNYNKYGNYFVNSEAAIKAFSSNEDAWNKVVASSSYTQGILGSEIAIAALDSNNPTTVPTMISNTAPSGTAFASSAYSGYDAYRAFDKIIGDSWAVGAGISYKDQYVGYDFVTPIWVYKMEIQFYTGKQNTDYVVEGSNDKDNGTWKILKDGLHENATKQTIILNNYNEKYRCYRIRLLSETAQSGSGNTTIPILQFYGK